MMNMKSLRGLLGLSFLVCVPAGVLWVLSPLGVHLSEYGFKTPNVFWKLFPSAPLLMLIGLTGVYFFYIKDRDLFVGLGFLVAALGALLAVAGDVGLYYLRLDNTFILSAPAWRTFRAGLIVLTLGTMVFASASARRRSLPAWGPLPLAVASLAGFISVLRDWGEVGAAMWGSFGAGWMWLGFALLFESLAGYLKNRKAAKAG